MRRLFLISLGLNAALGAGLLYKELVVHAEGGGGGVPAGNGDVNADGTIDLTDAVRILNWLFLGGEAPVEIECPPPGGGGLPGTGQKECYGFVEGQGWASVPCDSAEYPGQDGAYQAGCAMEGRFVENGDGTVTDNCTGLMWQKDAADTSENGSSGEEDRLYLENALKYCEGLNLAGHDDWRLPNVRELQSIVDYGRDDPAIDPIFGHVSGLYWSSSILANYPVYAWSVSFYVGSVYPYDAQVNPFHVRAVRGGL